MREVILHWLIYLSMIKQSERESGCVTENNETKKETKKERELLTMVIMLPVMALPLRFRSALRSRKARPRMGTWRRRQAHQGAVRGISQQRGVSLKRDREIEKERKRETGRERKKQRERERERERESSRVVCLYHF